MQVWINQDKPENVAAIVDALEASEQSHGKLKAFVMFVNGKPADLEKLAAEHHLKGTALTYLNGPDDGAVKLYGIKTDADAANTIFVYVNKTVKRKFVNFVADKAGVQALSAAIQEVAPN